MMDIKSKFIDEILNCPDVEWQPLRHVAKYIRGLTYNKNDESHDGVGYKVLRANNITLLGNRLNLDDMKTVGYHTKVKDSQKLFKNDILICSASGSVEHVGKVAFIDKDLEYYFGGFMGVIRCDNKIMHSKYMYYILTSNLFTKYLELTLNSATINNLNSKIIEDFIIPIPPLPSQQKIINVLDKFTELTLGLTAELTAEITARKQQYEYYRDELLTFDDVAWEELGEIANIETGHKPKEILETQTMFDYINAGTSRSGYSADGNCEGDTVTTPSRGQGGIGYVGYQPNPFWLGPLCYKIQSKNDNLIINKYLFYFLQSNNKLLLGLKKEAGVPAINKSDLAKLIIIYPTLIEQIKIVKILDKFGALLNSITESLPREIEFRQQQYEYYRDLLLSFPKHEETK